MIRNRIFQRYFLLATALLLFFVLLGFSFSVFLMRSIDPMRDLPRPVFIARIIDGLNPVDRAAALRDLIAWGGDFPVPALALVNDRGEIVLPESSEPLENWAALAKPENPYDSILVKRASGKAPVAMPPFGPMADGQHTLVRLAGPEELYLLIGSPALPPGGERSLALFPLIGLGSLILSLLLGVGTTIAIVYNGVQRGVQQADHVISQLHSGNLKARFEIKRKDEFGEAMRRFNFMADEIEKLVNDLRAADRTRTHLLQELAHDLRTPIASLRNLVETLDGRRKSLSEDVQAELTALALKEIDYFQRMVEDLLFLAQVKEPSLQDGHPLIDVTSLLIEEAEDCALRHQHRGRAIALDTTFVGAASFVHGDAFLLRRLFRNALENAFSFARSTVRLRVETASGGHVRIAVEDDGPGFTPEALSAFGRRRVSRKLDTSPNGRLSVGLGSVVMKAICEAHKGRIDVVNIGSESATRGACLTVNLPA